MPMMLDGSLMPVAHTMTSPRARHPKITKNCLAIIADERMLVLCLHWPAKAGLILNNDAKVRLFFEMEVIKVKRVIKVKG